MASIKIKFKPSTVADHEGTIFYQILHERKQRQLFSDYHVFLTECDENRSMVTTTQTSERRPLSFQFGNGYVGTWNGCMMWLIGFIDMAYLKKFYLSRFYYIILHKKG